MNRAFFLFLIAIIAGGLALCGSATADTGKMYDYRDMTLDNGLRMLTLEESMARRGITAEELAAAEAELRAEGLLDD